MRWSYLARRILKMSSPIPFLAGRRILLPRLLLRRTFYESAAPVAQRQTGALQREDRCGRIIGVHNEFTSIIEQDDEWFVAYSPESPGANGQGRSPEAAHENLAEAIDLILEDRRQTNQWGVPSR